MDFRMNTGVLIEGGAAFYEPFEGMLHDFAVKTGTRRVTITGCGYAINDPETLKEMISLNALPDNIKTAQIFHVVLTMHEMPPEYAQEILTRWAGSDIRGEYQMHMDFALNNISHGSLLQAPRAHGLKATYVDIYKSGLQQSTIRFVIGCMIS